MQRCIDTKKKSKPDWDGVMLECPTCREPADVSRGLRTDFRAASLMSDMTKVQATDNPIICGLCKEGEAAEAFCYSCNVGLCNFCVMSHRRQPDVYTDHSVVQLHEIGKEEMRAARRRALALSYKCSKHKTELLNFFCRTCDKLVCSTCVLMGHMDHDKHYIDEKLAQEQVEVLKKVYKPVQDHLSSVAEVCASYEDIRTGLKTDYKALLAEIQSVHRERVRDLQERETLLKARAEGLFMSLDKTLETELDRCQKTKEDMEAATHYLNEFITSPSNIEVVSETKQLVSKADSLHKACQNMEKPIKEMNGLEAQFAFVRSPSLAADGVGKIVRRLHTCTAVDPKAEVMQANEWTVDILALGACGKQLPEEKLCDGEVRCSASLLPPHESVHCSVANKGRGKYEIKCLPMFHGDAKMEVCLETGVRHSISVRVIRNYAPFFPEPFQIPLECSPWGVTVLPRNMLAVSTSDKQVKLYDINGGRFTRDIQSTFVRPYAMAVDGNGNLWVTDREAHNIRQFSLEQDCSRLLLKYGTKGSGNGYFLHPRGIAIHPDSGQIYVADMRNHRIQIFKYSDESEGQLEFVSAFGQEGREKGDLNQPAGILFNREGNLVVCDDRNCRLQVFAPDGKYIQNMGVSDKDKGLLCSAIGIAMDSHGRYIVSEFGCHCITFLSPEGTILGSLRSAGGDVRELVHPRGVAVDNNSGYVYIADFENQRIVRV